MNELTTKIFEDHPVRIIVENEETLFVGKDVCNVLGYNNPNDIMKKHCRGVSKRYPIADSLGRKQNARVLILSDVMRLICNSQLPAAQRFEAWVFEEVLPTIMRTGTYSISQAPAQPKTSFAPDATLRMEIAALKSEKAAAENAWQKLQKINWKIARKELEWCINHIPDWKMEELLIRIRREYPYAVRKEEPHERLIELEGGGK